MKATLPGDGIQFQHIDLNLKRYVEVDRGSRRVQTSCSSTWENEENCTLVIPRFHKVIKEWWSTVLKREGESLKQVSNHDSDIFTLEDKKKYGDFIPAICGPGDIRISRVDILHGSAACKSGKANDVRRWVVNPWFVAIQQDHETLDTAIHYGGSPHQCLFITYWMH